jgi:predicted DNA-binding antitoxin AbrB/MazE fold protein
MADVLMAVYENGILHPLGPVKLRERQTVRLQVLTDEPVDEADQIIEKLASAGLLSWPPGHSTVKPMSEKKRQEVASSLGRARGKPLSAIIMEERSEW